MKAWQQGFDLDELKKLEAFYAPHNKHALSVFGKFKKNDIAAHLHTETFQQINDVDGNILAAFVIEQSKVPSKITMFGKTVIGVKQKGDFTLSRLVGDRLTLAKELDQEGPYGSNDCWLITYAGNAPIRELAEFCGFEYVGYKVTSFAEVLAVYFRDDFMNFSHRKHPKVNPADLVGMAKISPADPTLLTSILSTLQHLDPKFTNHYSNYNTMNAWSALSLRGYSADPAFITKPAEMNNKWLEKHKDETFFLQDTPLYDLFPQVRQLLSFLDGEMHRVRFMQLAPGGGELLRHTDQVDPDAGNSLGALARLHFPLVTNEKVIFSTWNSNDEEEHYHYGFGECWVIDTRKPHKAVNGGTENRIHLVVDTVVTPKLERMICESQSNRIG
jgi:hypothetical protein